MGLQCSFCRLDYDATQDNFNFFPLGVILGAFYYGYMVFQIPGGWLALRVGGARLFGAAVMIASLFTLLTPMATRWNPVALIVLRILEGLVLVS